MVKVYPYHSSDPTDPDVYHDYDDCPAGSRIPWQNRRDGKGNNRRCKRCEDKD